MKNNPPVAARFIAYFIDSAVGMLLFGLILLSLVSTTNQNEILNKLVLTWVYWVGLGVIIFLVQTFLTSQFGGSLGKLITDLEVLDDKNNRISFGRSLWRNLVRSIISGQFFGLGFWWIFKDKEKKCWHDHISSTHVVAKKENGLITGLLTLGLLVFVNIYLYVNVFQKFQAQLPIYKSIVNEYMQQIKIDYDAKIESSKKQVYPRPSAVEEELEFFEDTGPVQDFE